MTKLTFVDFRGQLAAYLDTLTITSANIGEVRHSLFVPWPSEWNGIVREETARREGRAPAVPHPPEQAKVVLFVWGCATCGCLWRDNLDQTVSLFDAQQRSCEQCEHQPTSQACRPMPLTLMRLPEGTPDAYRQRLPQRDRMQTGDGATAPSSPTPDAPAAETRTMKTEPAEAPRPATPQVTQALDDLVFARSSHLAWAKHLEAHQASAESCPVCDKKPYKLDAAHEREWVAKYDNIIAIVKAAAVPPSAARASSASFTEFDK